MTQKYFRYLFFFFCLYLYLYALRATAQVKPSDIAGLSLWFSADSLQQNNPPFVSSVFDLSGQLNHAIQATGAKQPIVVANALNGHSIVRFDGIDDFFQFNSINDIRTVFWVIKEDANASPNFRLLLGHSSNYDFYRSGASIWAGPNTNTNILSGETRLNKAIVDGVITPVPTLFSLISIVTTGNVSADNLSIDRNISDRVWDGDFAELIIYNQALSPAEVAQIESYIQQKYAPPVSLGPDKTVCSLPITLYAKQNHFKSYSWQDASTGDSLIVSAPGSYSLNTIDIFGNSSSDTINIQLDNSNYAVSLGNDTNLCAGEQLTLTAGLPHLTYLWSDGSSGNSIQASATGSYVVSVTNCLGNVSADTLNMVVSPLPFFNLGADRVFCYNGNKTLDPGNFSGASGYTFLWSDNSSDSSLIVSASGIFSVTITDSFSCSASDEVEITIDSSLFSISLGADLSLCSGNSIFLTNGAGSGLNYLWSDLSSNDSLVITATSGTANYWVEVSNSNLCVNNDTIQVTVNGVAPNLSFVSNNVCLGDTVFFSNLSTSSDSIVSRVWDFGDNNTSNLLSPHHLYSDTGIYRVSLTETTNIGCAASMIKDVQVFPHPVANFSLSGLLHPQQNILFVDQSNDLGYSISSWSWDFGDSASGNSNTSPLHYPFHIFQDTGFFVVRLIVQSEKGCIDTLTQLIQIKAAPSAPASIQPSDVQGLSLWLNADSIELSGSGQGVQKVIDLASGANPALQADTSKQPNLIASALNGHNLLRFDGADDYLQFNEVNTIRTVFWVLKEDANAIPGFRLLLGDATSYDFYRDNSFIWAGANVNANILSGETRLNSQLVNGQTTPMPTNYALLSLVTTANVEADNFTYDRLNAGRVWDGELAELVIYDQPLSSPDLVNIELYFKNKYAPPVDLGKDLVVCSFPFSLKANKNYFASYIWQDFTTADSIVITNPGAYSVSVTDIFGRISSDTIVVIQDVSKYSVHLGADVSLCEGKPLFLTAGPSHLTYLWSDSSTESVLQVDTSGIYAVTVQDCLGNISSDTIQVNFNALPVFDLGLDALICYDQDFKLRTQLSVSIPNYYRFKWNDGSIDSTLVPIKSGLYTLQVSDPIGCSFEDAIQVTIDSLLYPATLGNDTSFCSGNFIQLQQGAAVVQDYLWSDNSTASSLQVIQPLGLNYFYAVELTDAFGCKKRDSIYVDITGVAPFIGFSFDTMLCIGDSTHFLDESTAPLGDTISDWQWSFGDNQSSSIQSPSHLYALPGSYTVTLKISTTEGCSAVLTKQVNVRPFPIANFTNPSSCERNETPFTNTSNTFGNVVLSYAWNFGDPTSGNANASALKNPKHIFSSNDTFDISLIVTTVYGCADTVRKTIITKPSPHARVSDTIACEGYPVNLGDVSTYPFPQFALSRSWNFNDGSAVQNSTQQQPLTTISHLYPNAGNYFATLSILASNGCRDSIRKNIFIVSKPQANFSYTKNCLNEFTQFADKSTQDSSYQVDSIVSRIWKFDNSSISFLRNPTFRFTSTGVHTVQLIVRTLHGCSDTLVKTILVKALPQVSFTKSAAAGDPPLLVIFTNTSAPEVSTFQWNFGDGGTSILENPSHAYSDTGSFIVTLTAADSSGCSGSSSQSIFIKQAVIDIAVIGVSTSIDSENYLVVKADLQNKSTRIITSLELYSQVNGQSGLRENWTGILPINGYLAYRFVSATKVENASESSYVCVEALQPNSLNDYYPFDNEYCIGFGENAFSLANPYPNPTLDNIVFPFVLPEDGPVTIKLYDAKGVLALELNGQVFLKGLNQLQLDMTNYKSGIYALQLTYKEKSSFKRFVKLNRSN